MLSLMTLQAGKRLSDAVASVAAKGAIPQPEQLTRWFSEWSALGWFCGR